jgi:hypothetical protein
MKTHLVPIMVRIRPESKALLLKAAKSQRRSQASLIDTMIIDTLQRQYGSTDERLSQLLKGPNA